ncbi:MAG: type II secretion system secretin GspD [Deltaproteobacteria bacterium]|nr:type II secretion system secretin GspD [Deltaproteobacteria bacterium]
MGRSWKENRVLNVDMNHSWRPLRHFVAGPLFVAMMGMISLGVGASPQQAPPPRPKVAPTPPNRPSPAQSAAARRAAAQKTAAAKRAAARASVTPSPVATPPAPAPAPSVPAASAGAPSAWDDVKNVENLEVNIEYKKPKRGARFAFNLVDADLIELIKIIGNITGKSFIIGGTVPKIKATIYAPTKITAEEAYQTFLSVLQVNNLTVMPSGRYLKVVPNKNAIAQNTPILQNVPNRDQIITRLQPLDYVSADDLAGLLAKFKSAEGDVTVYAPTNTLIITDYGTSIRRLIRLINMLDVPGTREEIWIEPVNYASADEIAARIQEIFDISAKSAKAAPAKPKKGVAAADAVGETEVNYSKVIADERTNSLIIVASKEGYLRILELVKVLDVPVAGEGTLHVIRLQHANAEELAKTLNSLAKTATKAKGKKNTTAQTELFEGDLNISADKATNSLVVVSSLRDYMSLKGVIDELDSMQRQVFVEAVIMEVSLEKDRNIGLGVHGGGMLGDGDKQSLLYGVSAPPGASSSLGLDPTSLTGLAAGVRGPDIPGSEELIGVSVPAFGVALHALQQNTDVNVLSTPHILATDNAEASITVGENVPVLQGVNTGAAMLGLLGSSNSNASNLSSLMNSGSLSSLTSSYSRQDVGITLAITPHINDDNQVRLEVDLEISEVKGIDPKSGPTISKQNAKTTSVVSDQQTFVLGGLITDNEVETTTKVPVLGDIPLLGMLFRNKISKTKKRNLLIFLTPYIIRSPADFREIFQRKMAERREFIERYTAFEYHRYDPHLDWSRTKGAISIINEVVGQAQEDQELRESTAREVVDEHMPKEPLYLDKVSHGTREEGDPDSDDIVEEPGKSPVVSQPLGGVSGAEPVVITNTGGDSE